MTAEQIVQQNLDAYNARDIEAFMSSFATDVALYSFGQAQPNTEGLASVREIYQQLFTASPNLFSEIVNRIAFDNKVIDYERITGRMGQATAIEMVLIYEVRSDKIFKITAIKQ